MKIKDNTMFVILTLVHVSSAVITDLVTIIIKWL